MLKTSGRLLFSLLIINKYYAPVKLKTLVKDAF